MANGQPANGGSSGGGGGGASKFGDIAKTFGVIAGSLLLPGFGQGYAQATEQRRQREFEQQKLTLNQQFDRERAGQNAALKIGMNAANLGDVDALTAVADKLDPTVAQALAAMASRNQAMFPQPGAAGAEEQQVTTAVGPSGVTRTLAPVPAAEQTRRAQVSGRKRITDLQNSFVTIYGASPQQARIAAAQQAQQEGLDVPKADLPLLQLAPPPFAQRGTPSAEAAPAVPGTAPGAVPAPGGGAVPLGIGAQKVAEEATARREVELDTPLSRADISLLADPQTGKPLPFGTTPRQAAQLNAVPLTATARTAQFAQKGAEQVLTEYEVLGAKLFTGIKGTQAIATGPKLFSEALTNPDSDARQIWELQAALPQIIRALGEKGTLAQQDVRRGLAAVPGFFETEKSYKRKLSTLRRILAAAAGKDTTPPPGALTTPSGITYKIE